VDLSGRTEKRSKKKRGEQEYMIKLRAIGENTTQRELRKRPKKRTDYELGRP